MKFSENRGTSRKSGLFISRLCVAVFCCKLPNSCNDPQLTVTPWADSTVYGPPVGGVVGSNLRNVPKMFVLIKVCGFEPLAKFSQLMVRKH